ncbi:hypothetical protein AAF712_014740 [Marasmius tenuissimus]|uniref:HD domain-containing protein n=1 Tax=Marasmius tenuissimus TaxID=585030 RepID=A0ABR2ZA80_9AGAR
MKLTAAVGLSLLSSLAAAATIPAAFDAFVPSNVPDFLQVANLTAQHVPLTELNALFSEADKKFNASHTYVSTVNTPAILNHNIRVMLYAYALLLTGFPSGHPSVEQISSKELRDRIYLSGMLHDVGLTKNEEAHQHLAHTTSFEIFGGFLAHDHLKSTAYPGVGTPIIGDVIQSTNLHTLVFTAGQSSATAQLLHICSAFDLLGWDGFGKGFDLFWHNQTIKEIETAYPRREFTQEFVAFFEETQAKTPDALIGHMVPPIDPAAVSAVTTLIRS